MQVMIFLIILKNPLPRPVVIRMKYNDIPLLHIHTTLENIGATKKNLKPGLEKINSINETNSKLIYTA
jgi:hypothetical protein